MLEVLTQQPNLRNKKEIAKLLPVFTKCSFFKTFLEENGMENLIDLMRRSYYE